jgi:hypothetical protein
MQKAMAKDSLEREKLQQQADLETARIGAQISNTNTKEELEKKKIASQDQIAGAKLGVEIAKDIMGKR